MSLAEKAGAKTAPHKAGKRRKSKSNIAIIAVLVTVILLVIVFLIVGVIYVYKSSDNTVNNPDTVSLTSHVTTPSEYSGKMAYYVVGILGKDSSTPCEMLSILCYNKEKQTINILEIPQDTYLGNSGEWAVTRTGNVWNNPKTLNWCKTCRVEVPDSEIKNGKHTKCNTAITKMAGSSSEDLCDVFNDQYGLPVDGYFMFPQEALVKLVDLLGGVDVNLESAMTVNSIKYAAGVRTLDGSAALYYITNRKSGISGDIDRIVRQRKVMLAIFQRLARESKTELTEDSLGPIMNCSTPIKTDFTRADLITLFLSMGKVDPASMTAYVLPGETGKVKSETYFAAHKTELLSLLNQSFRPFGTKLTEKDLGLTEINKKGTADTHKQVLSEIEVKQSGAIVTTTTTTAAK